MPNVCVTNVQRECGAGRCEEVIAALEEAVRRSPLDAIGYYQLGICSSGSCQNHSLVSPAMASAYLRRALSLAGATGLLRASILDALGNTLLLCADRSKDTALRESIDCHIETARIYRLLGDRRAWARAEFNLGNSYCELSEATGEDHWPEAVCHYENSLEVRTRKRDPEGCVVVLENLGTAYRRLSGGAAGENVRKAIACYRRALKLCSGAEDAARYAALENNLGNAFLSLPEARGAAAGRNVRRALRHFNRALSIQSAQPRSRAYGITQYNRAQAYLRLGDGDGPSAEMALACLEEAYAAFRSCGEQGYAELIRKQLEQMGCGACEHGNRHVHRA